jgi:hypothetical protein
MSSLVGGDRLMDSRSAVLATLSSSKGEIGTRDRMYILTPTDEGRADTSMQYFCQLQPMKEKPDLLSYRL